MKVASVERIDSPKHAVSVITMVVGVTKASTTASKAFVAVRRSLFGLEGWVSVMLSSKGAERRVASLLGFALLLLYKLEPRLSRYGENAY